MTTTTTTTTKTTKTTALTKGNIVSECTVGGGENRKSGSGEKQFYRSNPFVRPPHRLDDQEVIETKEGRKLGIIEISENEEKDRGENESSDDLRKGGEKEEKEKENEKEEEEYQATTIIHIADTKAIANPPLQASKKKIYGISPALISASIRDSIRQTSHVG